MTATPMRTSPVELGIVEGYFGTPWSWPDRTATMRALAPVGYRFFIYAPKAETRLRRQWRDPLPEDALDELARFAAACRAAGTRFGLGLSPYGAHLGFDEREKRSLTDKLAQLDEIGLDDLAILFDDMDAGAQDLASTQADIVHFAAARTSATRVLTCPSYYSDDPVLDRVFGARPPGYLAELGRLLDPSVGVFWTGEEVCARAQSAAALERVAERLRRKPVLWDNYPVNDGPRMSAHLHLRSFTGRSPEVAGAVAAHAINPALQPTLTRIPALTLADSYEAGPRYSYGAALRAAAASVAGEALGAMLVEDLMLLQDTGLDRLGDKRDELRDRYAAVDHPAAREVTAWLDGAYAVSGEVLRTQ